MGSRFVFFSGAPLLTLRKRERQLVGGPAWLAEYNGHRLRPTENKVPIMDPSGLSIRKEKLREEFATRQYEDWIEIVIRHPNGDVATRCFANPKWLVEDFEERLEDWKVAQTQI